MENKHTAGHLSALLTIIIWGTTFISTKILLVDFQPVEITPSSRLFTGTFPESLQCQGSGGMGTDMQPGRGL